MKENPYQSPQQPERTAASANDFLDRLRSKNVVARYIVVNLSLFTFYCGLAMLLTWIDVPVYEQHESWLRFVGPMVLASAIPVTFVVNLQITPEDHPHRVLMGMVTGLAAIALAFFPWNIIIIWFHLAIGGSL